MNRQMWLVLFFAPLLVLAQEWRYTPPAFPAVCTNPAVPGQWTMDYETARARAQVERRDIYLLFTGSTWCPDCDTLQHQVMSTPQMQAYMETSDSYWVWLDLPSRRATNAVDYGWLCHTNTELFTLVQSETILARNRRLEAVYGAVKGYRTPETLNMPTFVVCRPDGTYQGEVTHYRQSTDVTPEWFIGQIRRIWNDDAWDVQDNRVPCASDDTAASATLLTNIIEIAGLQEHTLSPTDMVDWYSFIAQPGRTYIFSAAGRLLEGQATLPPGVLAIAVYTEANAAVPAAVAVGSLAEPRTVSWELNQALPTKTYVKVSGGFASVAGYTFSFSRTAAETPVAHIVRGAEGAVVDVNDSARVAGLLTLSISRTGRMSAKYRSAGRTVSFRAKGFWQSVDGDGLLTAGLAQGDYRLVVHMSGPGEIYAVLVDPAYEQPLAATLNVAAWSRDNPAAAYAGYYLVSFQPETVTGALAPRGYSYMTVLLKPSALRHGKVTYAGKLADGTSFSGSTVLQPLEDGTAQMTLFARKGRSIIAGRFAIDPDAAESRLDNPSVFSVCGCTNPYWSHEAFQAATSFDVALDVTGVYYDSAESLADHYTVYADDRPLYLMTTDPAPVSAVHGPAEAVPLLALTVADHALTIAPGNENPTMTRLSFSRRTGIFRGTFRIPFVDPTGRAKRVLARYEGVVLPGWVGGDGCDLGCGEEVPEAPVRPFGAGAYWFRDLAPLDGAAGPRTVRFTASHPIILDPLAE